MPLYEYRCNQCGNVSEYLSKIGDTGDSITCKSCDSTDLEKVMSVTNVSTYPSPQGGKTCCGREEHCGTEKSCCGS